MRSTTTFLLLISYYCYSEEAEMRSTTTYVYNYVQQDLRACMYVCMCAYVPSLCYVRLIYALHVCLICEHMCVVHVNTHPRRLRVS